MGEENHLTGTDGGGQGDSSARWLANESLQGYGRKERMILTNNVMRGRAVFDGEEASQASPIFLLTSNLYACNLLGVFMEIVLQSIKDCDVLHIY